MPSQLPLFVLPEETRRREAKRRARAEFEAARRRGLEIRRAQRIVTVANRRAR